MPSAPARLRLNQSTAVLALALSIVLVASSDARAALYPPAAQVEHHASGPSGFPAIGDLNGDGVNDLVVTSDGFAKVLLGGPGGTLGPPTDVYAIGNAGQVLIQDLTGDGRNDLVLSEMNGFAAGSIVVLPGLAGGGFGPPLDYPAGIFPYPLAVGDLNGDGRLDVASGEVFGNRVSVMLGLPGGGFGPGTIYTVAPAAEIQSVAIGDLDGDGRNDIAAGGPNISATVLYGQAGGGFGNITEYDTDGVSYVVGIADLNTDGRMDLATVNGAGAVVYSGLPGGLLGSRADYVVPGDVGGLAIGDLNGDTRLDLVLGAFLTIGGPGTGSVTTLPGLPGGGFGAPSIYDSGEGTGHVAIGDLDGDGRADIAASHFGGTTVTVLSDLPDPPTPYYTGGRTHLSVLLGDLNGDGRPDMVAPNGVASFPQATVFTSLPGGGFAAADYGASRVARSVATGDVDGDGRIDLVVANTGASPLVNPGTVSVLRSLPGGGYGTNTDYAVGVNPAEVKLSDLDGDGWLDIVTANTSSHDVSVLMGQPGGTFGAETRYLTAGSGPAGFGVGDLDGDGRPDLAVLNATTRTISVMLGLGAGSFGAPTLLPTPTLPGNPVAIGDVNSDGIPDIAIASRVSTTPGTIGVASIYLGLGGGVFAPRTDYPAGPGVTSVAIADLDGDGELDLAAGGLGGLFVLLGLPGGSFGPPSAYSGFSPRRVQIGDMDGDDRPDLAFGIFQLVGVARNSGTALAVNHAPSITASASVTVPPGTPAHLMATAMDADPLQKVTITSTVSPPAPWIVPAGGVSALLPVVTASRSGTPGASNGGTYTITWTAIDNSTGAATGTATTVVTVPSTNQPPVVSIASPPSGSVFAVGTPVSFTGSFTDDTGDTHTAEWSFDALSTPGIVNEATGAVTASYTFTAAGVYNVSLTVTDNHGASGAANTVAEFSAMVVIYDPDAGFVTGGGWILSPAGAYPVNPSLAGKANFGFVSKYKKGVTVPIGETEFAFNVANMSFHSSVYEWLVIAGHKAQYKGSGTINGTGDYRFILTATDGQINGGGGVDKLRMKIWNGATSEIVYDNQAGDSDGATPVTALGGGSVVIHSSNGNAGDSPTNLESMKKFALLPNTPNPFNPETSIPYEVAATTRVRIRIFDSSGRLVTTVVDGVQNPGRHAVTWSGRTRFGSPAASGIYYVLMEAADHREKRAIVMLK